MRSWLLTSALALGIVGGAAAEGSVEGRYEHDGTEVRFTHVSALALDNTEGALDHPHLMRVLLSDRPVPLSALEGLAFPPVRALARAGQVEGVLLEFDPADPTSLEATVLTRPTDPDAFATTISMSNTSGVWERISAAGGRVSGRLREGADEGLSLSFDAVAETNPVVADLKGAEAQASAPVNVLVARAEALGRGDLAGAAALSAGPSAESLRAAPPEMLKAVAGQAPAMVRTFKAATRVVIRRDTAAVLTPDGGWASLVLENGAWKAAD